MNIFKTLGNGLSYKDVLQLDGAFSVVHVNYDKSPLFNGIDSQDMAKNSRKNSLSSYVGRHAIEIGFKYLLLQKTGQIIITHDLKILSNSLYSNYNISDSYMDDVDSFCELFCKYIEGGNVEYFRFPEYKANTYFAGNRLDINWLSYNLALIILKLIHFANLEDEM